MTEAEPLATRKEPPRGVGFRGPIRWCGEKMTQGDGACDGMATGPDDIWFLGKMGWSDGEGPRPWWCRLSRGCYLGLPGSRVGRAGHVQDDSKQYDKRSSPD